MGLRLHGKVAKLKTREGVFGVLFDWSAKMESGGISISSETYWIDQYAPRVRFAYCELVFPSQIISAKIDMGTQKYILDRLTKKDALFFKSEEVEIKKRSKS